MTDAKIWSKIRPGTERASLSDCSGFQPKPTDLDPAFLVPGSVGPLATARRSLALKKLYVGNLPFQATEEQLSTLFTQTGVTAANVTLVRDRFSGQPRGFGFVEVNSDEEAERAIQGLNGHDFMGRNIGVNEARPPREGGGGGRDRDRGDRGGGGDRRW